MSGEIFELSTRGEITVHGEFSVCALARVNCAERARIVSEIASGLKLGIEVRGRVEDWTVR